MNNNKLLSTRKNCNIKPDTTAFSYIKLTNQKTTTSSNKLHPKLFSIIVGLFLTLLSTQSHSQLDDDETKSIGINPEHTFQQKEKTEDVYADKNFVVSSGRKYSQIWKNINNEWQEIAVLNGCHMLVKANNISADGSKIALLSDNYTNNVSAEIWENTEKSWKITGESYGVSVHFNPKDSNEIILRTFNGVALYNLDENEQWKKNTEITMSKWAHCGGYSQDGKRLFFACDGEIIVLQKDAANNYIQHTSFLEEANKIFLSPVNNEFIVYRRYHFGYANASTKNTCYVTHGRFNEEDGSFNYNYLASFTELPTPEILNFSSSGNEIIIGDCNKRIIFKRQENNTWKTVKEFKIRKDYYDFDEFFSTDGTSVVLPSSLILMEIYTKNTDGNWDSCFNSIVKGEPLANTEIFEIPLEANMQVSEAIFTPDSKLLVAVVKANKRKGYATMGNDVIILEKCVNPCLGNHLIDRGRLIFHEISDAEFHLNKDYIIAVENEKLKISIYQLDKLN